MKSINANLISWYQENKRDLPWRNTSNPYFIWLSEIILQQTRVDQGMPYYLHFINTYPTVSDLANASNEQVMKSWEGLGYYSRARNLHSAAKYISEDLKGKFPTTYKDILELKGVGTYTAAAISSFAFNEVQAVLDGNVFRVLSRFYNESTPIDTGIGKKTFTFLSQEFLNKSDPANHNQAIMELGAKICTPRNPLCNGCPLLGQCATGNTMLWESLPVKSKKTKVKDLYKQFLLQQTSEGKIIIEKRDESNIWKNLYQFPLIESYEGFIDDTEIPEKIESISKTYKHLLSHRKIKAKFYKVKSLKLDPKYQSFLPEEMEQFAFPKLILNYLEDYPF